MNDNLNNSADDQEKEISGERQGINQIPYTVFHNHKPECIDKHMKITILPCMNLS